MAELVASPDSLVLFRNSQGSQGRGTLLHVTRHAVVLEVYNPFSIVQLSEVLEDVRILRREHAIYQGRAVVTTLVPAGALTIVSATLVDPWSDLSGLVGSEEIRAETERFIAAWDVGARLQPGYQLAVTKLASFLQELSRWLGQAETLYAKESGDSRTGALFEEVWPPLELKLAELFADFEAEARAVATHEAATHKSFAQRELHPLLLCDPFIHRSFTKPLGYAGDYQMVNMILAAAIPPSNTYAQVVSMFNLTRAPAVAHRNRVARLERQLRSEAQRVARSGRRFKVLNVGCGPATEVERFFQTGDDARSAELTLVDFNQETLEHAMSRVRTAQAATGFEADVLAVHQSIHELLKTAASGQSTLADRYDFVYCAGLFDYLSDRVCKRLVKLFYDWTLPGGLVVATNVHANNPIRYYMAHIAEWYLEYRDEAQFMRFAPHGADARVLTDATGVNLFLELRRPES